MTEAVNPELFSLASQLYVRMRRGSGRVVDAIYMAKSDDYAKEISAIAVKEQDPEVMELVKRFEALKMPKPIVLEPPVVVEPIPVLVAEPVKEQAKESVEKGDIFSMTLRPFRRKAEVPLVEPSAEVHEHIEEEVAHHYTGALR